MTLSYLTMHDPGKAGQHLDLIDDHPQRPIFGEDPLSTYKLQFGNFGGLPVKLAYLMMGAPLRVVAGSGMPIWLVKRHLRGRAGPRLEGTWQVVLRASRMLIALAWPTR